MLEERGKEIINESHCTNPAALAYRAATMANTARSLKTAAEARKQGIDLTAVNKAVQKDSSIEMARSIKATMDDPTDVSEFIRRMFRGPLGYAVYDVEVVEESHDRVVLEYHYCPLVKAWQNSGMSVQEIGDTCLNAMEGDLITAAEMGYDLDIQKTIGCGHGCCRLVYSRKVEG